MSDGLSEAYRGTYFSDKSKIEKEEMPDENKKIEIFKSGDIIKFKKWSKENKVPKIFKCVKYDKDWGVVWYNIRGKIDHVGISYVRKTNFWEKIIYKLKRK